MSKGFFITGTDTGVGKTYVAVNLIRAFRELQLKVSGFKPVASGAVWGNGRLENEDALALMHESNVPLSYEIVNPYCFEPAIAPHLAANQAGVDIAFSQIQSCYKKHAEASDVVIVEGAGGWKVPLGNQLSFDDVAIALDLPVILVVGLQLGCINHALLSEASILKKNRLAGWVGNVVSQEFGEADANMETLKELMASPCIGYFKQQSTKENNVVAVQANTAKLLDYLLEFS